MKNKETTLFLALLISSTLVFGQDYAFKVLANKGNNEVKSGDAWQPLKTGASLKSGDELKLADNCYIGLIHATGKPVEIKKAGNYKVTELAAQIGSGSSVLNKYTDFILSSNAEDKKNRLSATGAVHRATDNSSIKVMLPDNQFSGVYNAKAVINWDGSSVKGPYIVTLLNMFEDELEKIETPETSITVDLSAQKFAKENAILIEVRSKADPKQASKRYSVKKLTPAEQEKVKKSLSEILGEVAEETAMNKIYLANFYEQNNLYVDAITSYEEAIKLAPDVSSFKEQYEDFLIRNGLKK